MSKKVGLSLAVSGLVLAGLLLPLARISGTAHADEAEQKETPVLTNNLVNKSVDETVYVFLDADSNVKKTISSDWSKNDLGADVYTKTEGKVATPITMKVSYMLDGKEVTAEEIRGRSGRVKIRFDFANNDRVNGMYVPYAVVSGIVLPNGTFSNVELKNAKLINDGTRTMVAGLALPGMRENLGVNLNIPEYFEIEADAKEFKMEMTATVATSKIFANLDTSALNSVDALSSALQTLSDSMLQLLNGSTQLRDGLATLNDKTSVLADGVSQLRAGSLQLVDGAKALSGGIANAADGAKTIAGGLAQAYDKVKDSPTEMATAYEGAKAIDTGVNGLLTKLNGGFTELNTKTNSTTLVTSATKTFNDTLNALKHADAPIDAIFADVTLENFGQKIGTMMQTYGDNATVRGYLEQLSFFYGVIAYISGTNQIAAGVADSNPDIVKLKAGTSQLANGLKDASGKISQLSDGLAQLSAGATKLSTGLETAKEGSSNLHYGLMSLDAGISNMESNIPALTYGVSKLADGSKSLTSGLAQFNDAGVQKLVSLYNGNVKTLISKIQMMVNLSKSSSKTKYIYRTEEI